MDLCHLKNSELGPQCQKYKGRVVLQDDIVKDDSGSYAVFTEQGSSASQMTAAKVMDIVSRLPGCSGQAADAVSVFTLVKMEDASTLIKKIPKSECPDIWIRLPRHKWAKSWSSMEDPSRSSQKESVRSSFGRANYGKRNLRKFHWNTVGKSSKLGMFICEPSKRTIPISVCGRYQTGMQDRKNRTDLDNFMKVVDLRETTSFLDHVYLGCTQRECQISKDIVANYRDMFESRIFCWSERKTADQSFRET